MKIDGLHIRGFGKIKDFDAAFTDGLNIVYGPNESGKSTLIAFIRAAFYGLKSGRADKDGSLAPLKKYKPWNNTAYGGYINFKTENGSSYRLERWFDMNTVKLYDGLFNDITGQFPDAESLLGINETIFEKTVYIKQAGTKIEASASRDLINRIANISQSGSEDISVIKAVEILKETLKQHVGTGKSYTRPLDLIDRRLEELNTAKAEAQMKEKEFLQERALLLQISKDIACLQKKEELFSRVAELARLKGKIEILYRNKDEICFVNDTINQCKQDIDTMENEKTQLEQGLAKRSSKRKLWPVLSGAVILMATGTYILKQIKPWIIVPYILIILFIALGLLKIKSIKQVPEGTDHILNQQLNNLRVRIDSSRRQQEELRKRLETLESGFASGSISQVERGIDILSEKIMALYKEPDIALSAAEKNICTLIMDQYSEGAVQELAAFNASFAVNLQNKRLEEARLEEKIGKTPACSNEEIFNTEIGRLKQQKKSLEQKGEALNIAINILKDSADYVQTKYTPVMNKVYTNIFGGITGNKYYDVRAGENLSIMVNDTGIDTIVPVQMLSSGTIDQLYLSLRLAISETVLKTNESLPLIMDEPFAQYDDERTKNTLEYIYDISKQQQVIIFTCKQQEVELVSSCYPCKICSLT